MEVLDDLPFPHGAVGQAVGRIRGRHRDVALEGADADGLLEQSAAAGLGGVAFWIVDAAMMAKGKKDAIFLHCLPAHRGEEVAAEVIDGPQSVIYDEAENRLHIQKAIMYVLMKKK